MERLDFLKSPENGVYFFHYASQCLVWPFLPLFLSRYESDAQLGLLMGLCRVTSVLAAPCWAFWADSRASGRWPPFVFAWACWQALSVALVVVATRCGAALTVLAAVLRAVFEAPITPFAGVIRGPSMLGPRCVYVKV